MSAYFITSSGTGIGKTLVTTALCEQLRTQGKKVKALKPVISGYTDQDSDTALILKSCGLEVTQKTIDAISPWRFNAPLSPHMAAAQEGKTIELEALVEFCRSFSPSPLEGGGGVRGKPQTPTSNALKDSPLPNPPPQGGREFLLVEGAGGVMAPLNNQHTVLDWMAALGWPVILVGGSYLGSISHTLTALKALQNQPLPVATIVISESDMSTVSLADTADTIETFVRGAIPVVKIARGGVVPPLGGYV